MEPWKTTICQSEQCLKEAVDETGHVKKEYRILPDVDNSLMTQFTCSRCGQVETWGITRRHVAKVLYERLGHA
jgi:predicted nucleic-acid-binding Zn-ribbon protein